MTEYVAGCSATEAAKRAGYSDRSAYSQGQRLLKNAEVSNAVKARQADLAATSKMTRQEWVETMVRHARQAESEQVRVQALKELGKALGWYEPERHEHVLSGGITFVPPPEAPEELPE